MACATSCLFWVKSTSTRVRIEKVFSATQSFGVSAFRMLKEYCRVLYAKYPPNRRAVLHQDHHRDRRFGRREIGDLLRLAVVGDPEIIFGQPAQHVAVLVGDHRVHIHKVGFHRNGSLRSGALAPASGAPAAGRSGPMAARAAGPAEPIAGLPAAAREPPSRVEEYPEHRDRASQAVSARNHMFLCMFNLTRCQRKSRQCRCPDRHVAAQKTRLPLDPAAPNRHDSMKIGGRRCTLRFIRS